MWGTTPPKECGPLIVRVDSNTHIDIANMQCAMTDMPIDKHVTCGVSDQYLFIHLKKHEFYDNKTITFVYVAIRSTIVMYIFFDIIISNIAELLLLWGRGNQKTNKWLSDVL